MSSLFGFNFKRHHVCKLENDKKYDANQLKKMAIENYFIPRKIEEGKATLTNTVLFLTEIQKQQLAAHVEKSVPKNKIFSYDKPLVFDYPDKEANKFVCVQDLTAVVIVTNDARAKFVAGATVIFNPTVRLHYGNIGGTGVKVQRIFHLDDTTGFGMLEHKHFDFSAKQTNAMV